MNDARAGTVYFDGLSSRRRAVELKLGETLEIVEDGVTVASWQYDDIRRAEGRADVLRVHSLSAPELARIEIHDLELAGALAARTPLLDKLQKERSSAIKIVAWSLAAAASIVTVALVGVPYAADQLTPFIPQSFERRLGDAAQRQLHMIFDDKACDNAAGKAAFDKLLRQVREASGVEIAATSKVVTSSVPNAIALPGGTTYVFNGLLQKALSPDEIAAVIGHELGHVANRDHLRAMITNGGTSFLIGLLFGDVTGAGAAVFAATSIFNASYSRDAEARADGFAIDVMHRLGRSPKPLGELLMRIGGADRGRGLTILSNHPMTEDRLARMARAERPITGPELLTPSEWTALKRICS